MKLPAHNIVAVDFFSRLHHWTALIYWITWSFWTSKEKLFPFCKTPPVHSPPLVFKNKLGFNEILDKEYLISM
jgi:hypothetical protein